MWKVFSTQSRLGRVAPYLERAGRDMESSRQHAEEEKKKEKKKRGLHGAIKPWEDLGGDAKVILTCPGQKSPSYKTVPTPWNQQCIYSQTEQ